MPSPRVTDQKLSSMSDRLRLSYMRDHMAQMLEQATMAAHFSRICTFDSFDMSVQPTLDPGLIRELKKLEWIDSAETVLLLGPSGVGKTHLAIALGREAVVAGQSVLFMSATSLLQTLEKADRENTLQEKLAWLNKPKLLIIDELGYLPFSPRASHLLFQLVNRRYENKSILIKTHWRVGLDPGRSNSYNGHTG